MIERLKNHIAENNLSYFIETYGCQMNEHDSEKIAGILEALGCCPAQQKKEADIILFNTCCIREHAEARLMGNVGALKELKDQNKNAVIGVCGCMTQQKDTAQKLMRRFHFVDIVFGTNKAHMLPEMLSEVILEKKRVSYVDEDVSVKEGLPAKRNTEHNAFVNIIYGCNNFCTYCIVPYVRGRERSRKSADIINEINSLCQSGAVEVTLLGQNVNSYGKDLTGDLSFSELLKAIDKETDIKRVRFMTSHPKDLTEKLIECYGELKSLCEHIHLPVQSGSDRILELMNRRYTRAHYLSLIDRLKERVPDIAVTTDIIVGFPGETQQDFNETLSLVKEVGFDAAYTFAYSMRKLTKAAEMQGHLDKQTKAARLAELNSLISESVKAKNSAYVGRTTEVLVDSMSKRNGSDVVGRTRTAKTVNFEGSKDDVGKFVFVNIDKIKANTLYGKRTV